MSFKELQKKVYGFKSEQRLHKATQGFARFFASLFVLVGILLAAFGVIVTQVYQPKQAAQVDMWVLSDMWEKIFPFFKTSDMPIWAVVLIIGFGSALVAALVTLLFFFSGKALCGKKKLKEIEETVENARALQQYFDENMQTDPQADMGKKLKRFIFFFFIFFLTLTLMQIQAVEPDKIYSMGFLYAVLSLIAFYIFRTAFILPVQVCWKKNDTLENEIKTELQTTIKYLERKEKEAAEKHKAEQLTKEKQENLERAEAMFKAFTEEQSNDMHQLYKIAKLGHHDATLKYIEWCLPKTVSPELTRVEQKRFLQMMYDALIVVGKYDEHSNVTKFFYYSAMMGLGKIKDKKTAQEALDELRCIKNSGDLSEEHTEVCTELIEALVKFINKLY